MPTGSTSELHPSQAGARARTPWRARGIGLAIALAATSAAPSARAEPTDAELAAARQLFKDGKDLETKGAWADALSSFKKVGEVKMTPQVRFHIALCDENLGKLVSAINGFELAAEEAKLPGSNAPEVAENATTRAAALRSRVPTVRLVITGKLSRSQLLLDGSPVLSALVGSAIPLDVGSHTVDLMTDGKRAFHRDLSLAEKSVEEVKIDVHDDVLPAAANPQAPAPLVAIAPKPLPDEKKPESLSGARTAAIVVGVLGVGSLAGAGVFFGKRQGTISDLDAACPTRTNCPSSLQSEASSGKTDATVATVLVVAGAVGVGAAAGLWFAFPPKPKPTTAWISPPAVCSIDVGPSGLSIRGTF